MSNRDQGLTTTDPEELPPDVDVGDALEQRRPLVDRESDVVERLSTEVSEADELDQRTMVEVDDEAWPPDTDVSSGPADQVSGADRASWDGRC